MKATRVEFKGKVYVIDCSSKILGRLASQTAKLLLLGNKVTLVNAEKAAISGHGRDIVDSYKQKVEWQDKANPEHSPYWSRRPDFLVKRIIRGMLPYKQPRGKMAFKNLTVFMGVPASISKDGFAKIETKSKRETYEGAMTVEELSEKLGYKVR
ncbi:50S ribosomal protein L13 [uncultured archaeon]|nr:50S ribosomal protein L13 [uncultured archaeon]